MKRSRPRGRSSGGPGWAVVDDTPTQDRTDVDSPGHEGPPLARLSLERRRGKPVTVVSVTGMPADQVKLLSRELKTRCSTGGSVKDTSLELQGDHRALLRETLAGRGLRVRG